MNILLISQCSKNARVETCRILDRFAERKGDATWQTAITLEGLETLRRLLRKTARRNTAVACHWIKKSGQTDLLWIAGNPRRFGVTGAVPTNRTSRDILRSQHESNWRSMESIALLAGVAGLFHDFGKAGALFQDNLQGKKGTHRYQPFRHEWISVRLFQAFIGEQSDKEWLKKLGTLTGNDEAAWLDRLHRDNKEQSNSPFIGMPPLAQVVAWLILSHHRLPQFLGENEPTLSGSETWLTNQLNVYWNALNHLSDWRVSDFHRVWTFPGGTPLQSSTWRKKAQQLAKRATHAVSLQDFGALNQTFTVHLARLALMLADHHYSAHDPVTGWQDKSYRAWANTDRKTGELKQKLDEHTVGVSHHAFLLGRTFPALRGQLPAITRHKGFRERARDERFRWQNRAWDVAEGLRERSRKQGFFGINMASTGCGKTLANARIMYALSQEEEGCRFTVALGLRTLTLQTGDALRSRLGLGEDDLAVLIGSCAVRELHQRENEPDTSSVSAEELFESHQYVHYDDVTNTGPLRQWLEKDIKLRQLVDAPVLVATIDHLMPATEGVRGGKQIAPMLRLLTSDLVLDEPDDFDINDQHALCRLVNWTGMLGGRVLLSSATLPPALVQALFIAYCTGRKAYQQACGEPGQPLNVCCAWFDEDDSRPGEFSNPTDFYQAHCEFAARRARRLPEKPVLRKANIVTVSPASSRADSVIAAVAQVFYREMFALHDKHNESRGGKTVSLGLVRMANINPLVATAKALMGMPSPDGYCVHYCVYHSQHPLMMRSHMEKRLDEAFSRHDPNTLWQQPEIRRAVEQSSAQHHLFVVLATSVVEVGRDWDADWGIIEPSSMRSLIQFSGRIQRHRQNIPESSNVLILNKNIRGYCRETPAMCKPGFETADFPLTSHDLTEILQPEHYCSINAAPRILDIPPGKIERYDSLVALEHGRSWQELLGKNKKDRAVASDWWSKSMNWNGELQRRKPFRNSQPEKQYFLRMEDEFDEPKFMFRDEGCAAGWKEAGVFTPQELEMAEGVSSWMADEYAEVMQQVAETRELELADVSDRYGEINLRFKEGDTDAWLWHPLLGVFRALD
ncbi:type I-F CRISPR-associated helicase Cas3f [Cedecea colo]|uniref:Type I-F CRISPR-associated helicase Cas3 n=1 Tax=Cedecea colo TaxID=2552946 RepID=A0ABX0VLM1_9ENTR|nr:type I-F CRISPR-associated helicase Cas3f [Cedecea colo]NIY47476.1 type I-F CRISPR-associated helicase Cas3 [Cedecea colo]